MSSQMGGLRSSLTETYLAASAALTRHMLRGRVGQRDFRRVIVVAPLGRNNGIASGARLQWAALRALGVDAELLDATPALRNPLFRAAHKPGSAYVLHAGGPQTAALISSVLPHAANAYRIGYWAWELPDPPLRWAGCERNLAEIWTPSAFSKTSLVQLIDRPVEVVPHHVPARPPRRRPANAPFIVLSMADARSSWSRKNPEGALQAFRAAFGTSSEARFVLKLAGSIQELRALETRLGDLPVAGNIEVIRGHLDDIRLDALYRRADILLSVHRAEGFGLPMREAMAYGLPVVATGWSGNLDFMDDSNSSLVPYRLGPVNDLSAIYHGSKWAEPDLEAAARVLRRLADDPRFYTQLAAAAHRSASAAAPRFPFQTPQGAVEAREPVYA